MPRRREELQMPISSASDLIAKLLQQASDPGGKFTLRIETDPRDGTVSFEVVTSQRFSVPGVGFDAVAGVMRGVGNRLGAVVERQTAIHLERALQALDRPIEESRNDNG